MLGGYAGKILWVDLTTRQWRTEDVTEEMARKWIGGSGWAAAIVPKMVPASADPLGPENILGFFTGPLTGTMVPSSGRHSVAGKSPLTGIWGEASVGGSWGKALKHAGYDALILTGQATEPVYLWINEETVEIRPAGSLWGLDTYEIEEAVREQTHPKAEVCSIGPAGERLARIAGLFTDGREGRAAARCGLGAVAGSKKVKAIAVYGQKNPPLVHKEELLKRIKAALPAIKERTKGLANFGTAGLVIPCEQLGDFPVKNWSLGSWEEGAQKISGVQLAERFLTGRFHCAGCPIGCGRRIAINQGRYTSVNGGGPEYETLGVFGGSCLIDDLEAICYANELCNRYGIDTIDAGNLVAFSIEAFEKGIISKQDTGGRELKWGDPDTLIGLIKEMGEGQGFGAILAEGFPALAQRYGDAVKEMGITAKGLSFPSHEPRAYNSIAVGYATANRGACHLEAFSHAFERNVSMPDLGINQPLDRFASEGKGVMVAQAQNLMMVFDSIAACKFLLFGGVTPTIISEWLSLATGVEWNKDDLLKCGERIFNQKRLFNIHCGISRKDDTLPERILKQPRGSGGAATNLPPLETMLDEYYSFRGWDANGIPTEAKLRELGLV
ncbi:Aldehyde ferredoxin oxidoreductase, C-terminal [Moorella glycerini]|uniref:Oxidoreductase YdhV n=1 Tax=Neomoorella stamsii TaxID=1266720 RepID=A0A9X7J5N5_9FIRM|nr:MULTISPECIES: aldehyde ferredoxin oxidoreductase family protein [Moorella]PRR75641.1 putative oxidoreductase YdhV [Moorella stamsii]CEP66497.1 Aldehyde ferredoxin oxidoreductase, C-terminal [Moorella glycerini]